MVMPIIGKKSNAEKMATLQQESEIAYQKEMLGKLEEWGLENECLISPALVKRGTIDSEITAAVIAFKKLSNEELLKYKVIKNQEENVRNQANQSNKKY